MKLDSFDKMLEDYASGISDFTKDGKCSCCGECCTNILPMSDAEIRAVRAFVRRFHIREELHRPPVVGDIIDMSCPFRNNRERKCNIYPARPAICRDFQCNKPPQSAGADILTGKRRIVYLRDEFFPK